MGVDGVYKTFSKISGAFDWEIAGDKLEFEITFEFGEEITARRASLLWRI